MSKFLGVFILFGLTWIFGALTAIEADQAFEVVFTVINSLQGFLIFIFFCALNNDVRLALSDMLKRHHILHHGISTTGSKSSNASSQSTSCGTKLETMKNNDDTKGEIIFNYPSAMNSHTHSLERDGMTGLTMITSDSKDAKNMKTSQRNM